MIPLLTIREAAGILKVHTKTVEQLLRRGEISRVKLGHRTVRITEAALAAWVKRRDV